MSRCNIHFASKHGTVRANIYRHFDGDRGSIMADLDVFFLDVRLQCGNDTRFDDPEYLAAKFLVWQADRYCEDKRPLNFTGVAPVLHDAGDGEYIHTVHCVDRAEIPGVETRSA